MWSPDVTAHVSARFGGWDGLLELLGEGGEGIKEPGNCLPGLSPRMRGTNPRLFVQFLLSRFIPHEGNMVDVYHYLKIKASNKNQILLSLLTKCLDVLMLSFIMESEVRYGCVVCFYQWCDSCRQQYQWPRTRCACHNSGSGGGLE